MPRKCCICQATGKMKFSEIPSNPILREKWLQVIPNKHKLGGNPVVCDRHFQESDYDPNCTKRRVLKKGVVPMVIPHSDMNFEPHVEEGNQERYLNFYNKEIKEKSVELLEMKSKLQQVENSIKDITKEDGNVDNQVKSVGQQFIQFTEENNKKTLKIEFFLSKLKNFKSQLSLQQQELKQKDKIISQLNKKLQVAEKVAKARSRWTKVNITDQENQLRDHSILNENAGREGKLKTYNEKVEQMIRNMYRDRKAAFLLDQIKLYNCKSPRYTDTTLQECILWEDSDPGGYQFVRDSDLLTLPSLGTMKKNLGFLPGETVSQDTSSIVETSVLQESEKCTEIVAVSGHDNEVSLNTSDEHSTQVISEVIHISDDSDFLVKSCGGDEDLTQVISEVIHMPDGRSYIHLGGQEIEVSFDS